LLAFTDVDSLRALEVITTRRPQRVTLERLFAATPRGAALIDRITSDPSLVDSEIQVIAHDTDYSHVLQRQPDRLALQGSGSSTAAAPAAPAVAPLDQRGTRRAPRVKIAANVEIMVDGNTAALVDLSSVGAQVVSTGVLKPNQRVRVALADDLGNVRLNAAVAWAKFEIPPGSGPRYRAGLDFVNADPRAVDTYCARHKAP
jgi:PilZ domain-containing protein